MTARSNSESSRTRRAEFARALGQLRQESGYRSARGFYRAQGGRTFFLCSYEQYANVEAGRSLPGPVLASRLAAALQLSLFPTRARSFFHAYLRALLEGEDLLQLALAALTSPAAAPAPLRQALGRFIEEREHRVTSEQADAMYSDEASYWISTVLCNDSGAWGVEEFERRFGFGRTKVARALERLARVGFAIPAGGGRYRCVAAGKLIVLPRALSHSADEREGRFRASVERLALRHGRQELRQYLYVRASAMAMRQYYPFFAQAVFGAEIYGTPQSGPDTGLYLVEGSIRKILPL